MMEALPGYKNVLPFVYAGFFPVSNDQYKELKEAIETVEGFVKRETERGMGLNYYTILGRLYEKNGEQEQAEKYIRLGEELEAERMERYKKMMNL